MDKYLGRMQKTYEIAKNVLDHRDWYSTEQSTPRQLTNGQIGYEIAKIQYGNDGEYSNEVNGIAAIAARDHNGVDYFLIKALCDEPEVVRFDASDVEIAATIGRCAQITEDFLGACHHAWQ